MNDYHTVSMQEHKQACFHLGSGHAMRHSPTGIDYTANGSAWRSRPGDAVLADVLADRKHPRRQPDFLRRAAVERRIAGEQPWSQQQIVQEALREWIEERGYEV